VDNASAGDTIIVRDETYTENIGVNRNPRDSVSSSPKDYKKRIMHDFLTGKIDSLPEAKDYEPPKNFESLPKPIPPVKQDILIYRLHPKTKGSSVVSPRDFYQNLLLLRGVHEK